MRNIPTLGDKNNVLAEIIYTDHLIAWHFSRTIYYHSKHGQNFKSINHESEAEQSQPIKAENLSHSSRENGSH